MTALWHYTCDHGNEGITRDSVVRSIGSLAPTQRPAAIHEDLWMLAWFTDLDVPHPQALGLTMVSLSCDRTKHRWSVVNPADCIPWARVRSIVHPSALDLELAPGAMPGNWWVSLKPVAVVSS